MSEHKLQERDEAFLEDYKNSFFGYSELSVTIVLPKIIELLL